MSATCFPYSVTFHCFIFPTNFVTFQQWYKFVRPFSVVKLKWVSLVCLMHKSLHLWPALANLIFFSDSFLELKIVAPKKRDMKTVKYIFAFMTWWSKSRKDSTKRILLACLLSYLCPRSHRFAFLNCETPNCLTLFTYVGIWHDGWDGLGFYKYHSRDVSHSILHRLL